MYLRVIHDSLSLSLSLDSFVEIERKLSHFTLAWMITYDPGAPGAPGAAESKLVCYAMRLK